ncbi:NUDIX hydrolase [Corynebacterium aquilae]|uniref:NUDIX hydrolase n=1 Tax=Corynebacterium aquilae DSM 44791 TaxID=1431546 RepID=A0A1L7CFG8_9CORY|nr:NUDIX domain-containing protein [Corynebacterium aquilae]APT84575.1 hypothetical protein CAQU_05305 [Corynebacterium aquilae DSM 44791]
MEGHQGRKLSATVLLVRDSDNGIEVYAQERTHTMPSFPSTTVFPGGGVDARDFDISRPHLWAGPDSRHFSQLLGVDRAKARALTFAAVREVFEEAGLLLAVDTTGTVLKDATSYHHQRLAMEAHMLPLHQFLDNEHLRIDSSLLTPFAHWIGPPNLPIERQFDTFSFLAHCPEGQEPDDIHTRETTSAGWFQPHLLLEGFKAGLLHLVLPTWSQLQRLAAASTVADLFANPPAYPLVVETEAQPDDPRYREYFAIRATRPPRRF